MPDPLAVAAHLFGGSGLIYRHFGAPDRLATAQALAEMSRKKSFKLLIGNDPELAQKVGANGVHWAEAKLDQAGKWANRFEIMTAAAHSKTAMIRAREASMNAVLVSAVFPSASPSAGAPIGPEALREWAENVQIPTYGLGGVTEDNFDQIHGFAGAAMIGAATMLGDKSRI